MRRIEHGAEGKETGIDTVDYRNRHHVHVHTMYRYHRWNEGRKGTVTMGRGLVPAGKNIEGAILGRGSKVKCRDEAKVVLEGCHFGF